jgi:hypothetical protein
MTMTMTTKHLPQDLELPHLSDDAVIEIHAFLEHLLRLFESRYLAQFQRYYNHRTQANLFADRTDTPSDQHDLPF